MPSITPMRTYILRHLLYVGWILILIPVAWSLAHHGRASAGFDPVPPSASLVGFYGSTDSSSSGGGYVGGFFGGGYRGGK